MDKAATTPRRPAHNVAGFYSFYRGGVKSRYLLSSYKSASFRAEGNARLFADRRAFFLSILFP